MYETERKDDPNYPFSIEMVFCSIHNRDSNVVDVDKCEACSKPGYKTGHPLSQNVNTSKQVGAIPWICVSEQPPAIEDHFGVMESGLLLSRRDNGTPIVSYVAKNGEWFGYWGNNRIPRQSHYIYLELSAVPASQSK